MKEGRTSMSPAWLMITLCPVRLYRNRNLGARGTASWSLITCQVAYTACGSSMRSDHVFLGRAQTRSKYTFLPRVPADSAPRACSLHSCHQMHAVFSSCHAHILFSSLSGAYKQAAPGCTRAQRRCLPTRGLPKVMHVIRGDRRCSCAPRAMSCAASCASAPPRECPALRPASGHRRGRGKQMMHTSGNGVPSARYRWIPKQSGACEIRVALFSSSVKGGQARADICKHRQAGACRHLQAQPHAPCITCDNDAHGGRRRCQRTPCRGGPMTRSVTVTLRPLRVQLWRKPRCASGRRPHLPRLGGCHRAPRPARRRCLGSARVEA